MQAIATKAFAELMKPDTPKDSHSGAFATFLGELRYEMYPAWRNAGGGARLNTSATLKRWIGWWKTVCAWACPCWTRLAP